MSQDSFSDNGGFDPDNPWGPMAYPTRTMGPLEFETIADETEPLDDLLPRKGDYSVPPLPALLPAGAVWDVVLDEVMARLTKAPVRDVYQLGDPYRSDLHPRNYKTQRYYIADTDLAQLAAGAVVLDLQTDFPVWSMMLREQREAVSNVGPANQIVVADLGLRVINDFLFLDKGVNNVQVKHLGAAVAGVQGAGYWLTVYDRWIPQPFGFVGAAAAGGGTPTQLVTLIPGASAAAAPLNSTSVALETNRVIKATAGTLYGLSGINNAAFGQYIQLHDAAALPADGAVPSVVVFVPAASNFSLDYEDLGRRFSIGIVACNSTTLATKTIGAANCWFDGQFE